MYASAACLAPTATGEERIFLLTSGPKIFQATTDLATTSISGTLTPALDYTCGLVYMNGYLFAAGSAGSGVNRIYNSDGAAAYTTWPTTNFIATEQFSDNISFIAKHHNHIVAVGPRSVEFFYDGQVEIGSPLVRQETYTSQIGAYTLATTDSRRFAQIGDDIYFPGQTAGIGGISIYRIRDFKVERVSTQYIDERLSFGADDAVAVPMKDIKVIQTMGKPMILVRLSSNIHMVFNPETDQWWELESTNEIDFSLVVGDMMTPVGLSLAPARFIYRTSSSATIYVGKATRFAGGALTGHFNTDVWDGGVNNMKHIKWVDLVGTYGTNTMTGTYYKEPAYGVSDSLVTFTGVITNPTNVFRWRNLGRARRVAFKVSFDGISDISHEAIEIGYNIGTW